MALGALAAAVRLLSDFDPLAFADVLVTLFGMGLAFYLNNKLIADYFLDKELQKTNPEQREDSLIFTR
jgi:hypothetical protein